ncbi:MAG: hypothetical protein ABI988_11110 [Nitrospirota bacterium]
MYRLNAVDSVTPFQLDATCEKISEACLLPVIQQQLEGFPCVILGFHADNGSESIHYKVAMFLEKLRLESADKARATRTDHGGSRPDRLEECSHVGSPLPTRRWNRFRHV